MPWQISRGTAPGYSCICRGHLEPWHDTAYGVSISFSSISCWKDQHSRELMIHCHFQGAMPQFHSANINAFVVSPRDAPCNEALLYPPQPLGVQYRGIKEPAASAQVSSSSVIVLYETRAKPCSSHCLARARPDNSYSSAHCQVVCMPYHTIMGRWC